MFSVTFIKRPILAIVISLIIIVAGTVSLFVLPVSEFPDVAPPTVTVSASYTGANAFVVEDTVTRVLEDKLNGIKGVIYMDSSSSSSGESNPIVFDDHQLINTPVKINLSKEKLKMIVGSNRQF